jgi:hypothetical protein
MTVQRLSDQELDRKLRELLAGAVNTRRQMERLHKLMVPASEDDRLWPIRIDIFARIGNVFTEATKLETEVAKLLKDRADAKELMKHKVENGEQQLESYEKAEYILDAPE